MIQISCDNLSLAYEGRIVTENINLTVESGEYLCIIGDNGVGKSTLLKALTGLKTPAGGTVKWENGFNPSQAGYLPQQDLLQRDFPASVREIVMSGFAGRKRHSPLYTKREKETAKKKMADLGICALEKKCYSELSGGQQQRVLIARALCAASTMLLLDEPAAGLDPSASAELYGLLSAINKNDKMTIVMVTHDIEAAIKYASHILHLDRSPLFCGTVADYKAAQLNL